MARVKQTRTRSLDIGDRRTELVEAAYDLVATKGLEGLRTRDVAAQVGVNIATLHYYFETKEALLAALVGHVTGRFTALQAPLPARATPLDELRSLVVGQTRRRRVRTRIDIVMQELMLRSRRDPQLRQAFARLLATWRARIEELVVRGKRRKVVRKDAKPKQVSAILTAFLIGATVQIGIAPTAFPLTATAEHLLAWLKPKR